MGEWAAFVALSPRSFAQEHVPRPSIPPINAMVNEFCLHIHPCAEACERITGLAKPTASSPFRSNTRFSARGMLYTEIPKFDDLRTAIVRLPASWAERRPMAEALLRGRPGRTVSTAVKTEWDLLIDAVLGLDSKAQMRAEERAGREGKADSDGLCLAAPPYYLWSPYDALEEMLQAAGPRLPRGATLADLGSGIGRVGLYLAIVRPDLRVVGYEYDSPRAAVANEVASRFGLSFRTVVRDLSTGRLPPADAYYLFNPFDQRISAFVRHALAREATQRSFVVISFNDEQEFGVGRGFVNLIRGAFPMFEFEHLPWTVSSSRGRPESVVRSSPRP